MTFRMVHSNRNVRDLARSLAFYRDALGFTEVRRHAAGDGSFIIVFLRGEGADFELELTWLRDFDRPYELGDNELHLAVRASDFALALARHREMGCICYENTAMGIYFIEDPDGYWVEIVP